MLVELKKIESSLNTSHGDETLAIEKILPKMQMENSLMQMENSLISTIFIQVHLGNETQKIHFQLILGTSSERGFERF